MKLPVMINPKFSYCSIYAHYKESGIGDNFCKNLSKTDTSINGMIVRLCCQSPSYMACSVRNKGN